MKSRYLFVGIVSAVLISSALLFLRHQALHAHASAAEAVHSSLDNREAPKDAFGVIESHSGEIKQANDDVEGSTPYYENPDSDSPNRFDSYHNDTHMEHPSTAVSAPIAPMAVRTQDVQDHVYGVIEIGPKGIKGTAIELGSPNQTSDEPPAKTLKQYYPRPHAYEADPGVRMTAAVADLRREIEDEFNVSEDH